MIVEWTPFALAQLNDILETIKENQSLDVALKWQFKIDNAVAELEDFPFIGPPLPPSTYQGLADFFKGLRQLIVKPYRIVYEVKDDRCEILQRADAHAARTIAPPPGRAHCPQRARHRPHPVEPGHAPPVPPRAEVPAGG